MLLQDQPIKRKLIRVILITCGSVLLLTSSIYFIYEVVTFRRTTVGELSILGQVIAANSTAALAFDSPDDAYEILASLKAQPHIVEASLYDGQGNLFSYYPDDANSLDTLDASSNETYSFKEGALIGVVPIVEREIRLGTLFIRSDLTAMYDRFKLYGGTALAVAALSFVLALALSRGMHKGITKPILALAETAKAVENRSDYSVRATKFGNDEIGLLTDAFNQMLSQIEKQNREIQVFNQKLEEKIAERTSQLEAINKELESFSYSVSHDLRAPLRSVDGYSRILLEDYNDKLDDEGRRVLNVVIYNAQRMGHLIDDLLTFSRVGKQSLAKITLDMNALVLNVVEDVKAQYDKNPDITVNDLPQVMGDSSMLRQVMTNLVSNAIKYSMKKENPTVEIGANKEGDRIVFQVKDNGAGFDMLYYDKLFGVFQRLHSNKEFEGTGVGLALVHRIISKHGGEVWAKAEVEKGATFFFSLPESNNQAKEI